MQKKKMRALIVALCGILFAGVIYICFLQYQISQLRPVIKAYLPEDIYVAVDSTTELYNNEVAWSGMTDSYSFNWICEVGQNLEDSFLVKGQEDQIGDYPLTLTIYDYNMREVMTLTSTLHVVDQVLEQEYSILNIGDSLSNGREWYRTIYHLSGEKITFTGTRGWTRYAHEGRSGFSASDYLAPTEYTFEGEGVQPFYDPVQKMFDWNYYKLSTGIDPDIIQIFLGTNGLKDDPGDTISAITTMVNSIRRYDSEIPIYIVNTIYTGDQDHIAAASVSNSFFRGEFKLRNDKRIFDLMTGLTRKLGNYSHVTFIPLAIMHDSANNFDTDEALHPNEDGYQQFAEAMFSVYCGTLE